jgi:hypothetical protein
MSEFHEWADAPILQMVSQIKNYTSDFLLSSSAIPEAPRQEGTIAPSVFLWPHGMFGNVWR